MKKRNGIHIPSHIVLLILSIICVSILFFGYAVPSFSGGPLGTVASYVFLPMQKGIGAVGERLYDTAQEGKSKNELITENNALRAQIEELESRLTNIQLQENELESLRELYELDQSYSQYNTTGAYIIGRSSTNWFSSFTIDKGSADGIKVDMNVIAGSGLVGIVTDVGSHYAIVRSIIDDTSSVSGMVVSSGDNCIVSGDLEKMTESNLIRFEGLEDTKDKVKEGDAIVTSNISDKYRKDILVGYISGIQKDANDLTKSGTIAPVVDFKHLTEVLVIKDLKATGAETSEGDSE